MKETTKNWQELALRDIKAAQELLKEEFYSNIVCFLSQQAVEKILKAVLDEFSISIPRIHSVLRLYSMLPAKVQSVLNINKQELSDIDKIYTETRYPSEVGLLPNGFPSKKTATKFYNISHNIFNKINDFLNNQ